MTVTAVANLAVKVEDIDSAVDWYRGHGAKVSDPIEWEGARRADVSLGELKMTLFTRAIYENSADLPAEGFLHVAVMSDDLQGELADARPMWGPEIVRGPFGVRRIVFFDAPGGIRIELMEQLEPAN